MPGRSLPPRAHTGPRRRAWVLALTDLLIVAAAALVILPLDWAIAVALLWPVGVALAGGYPRRAMTMLGAEARIVVKIAVLGLVSVEVIDMLWGATPRHRVLQVIALACVGSLVVRVVASVFPALGGYRRGQRSLVLVGTDHGIRSALADLGRSSRAYRVAAACVLEVIEGAEFDVPTVHGIDRVLETVRRYDADAVLVLNGHRLTPDQIRRLTWGLEVTDTEFLVSSGLVDVSPRRATVTRAGVIPVLHVERAEMHGARRLVKDALERLAALALLIAALPVLGVVMVLIRLESPGSPIFRQQRIGRNERPFTMLKLRSMCADAEARKAELADRNEFDDVMFKISDDPRITRVGRFIRRYSIDELPQLWNVVRGDMALVGPRPATADEVEKYSDDARRRMAVKPGLTGLWQVSGRSSLTWQQSVRLDLQYVDNWSLGLDAGIVARTGRAVLGHDGAY